MCWRRGGREKKKLNMKTSNRFRTFHFLYSFHAIFLHVCGGVYINLLHLLIYYFTLFLCMNICLYRVLFFYIFVLLSFTIIIMINIPISIIIIIIYFSLYPPYLFVFPIPLGEIQLLVLLLLLLLTTVLKIASHLLPYPRELGAYYSLIYG